MNRLMICLVLVFGMAQLVNAQENNHNKECELIANLTGDYYHHKQSGLSKQEVQQTKRPEFANETFLKVVDLAINLAYTFPDDMDENDVETRVFAGCEQHQPEP